VRVTTEALQAAARPRAYVAVSGPEAAAYLQRMVSNDVEALDPGGSCQALLLTAKARLVAPLIVLRRGIDDYLLLTEPELGDRVVSELLRFRFAAKCTIEVERHTSTVVLGEPAPGGSIPTSDYGVPAYELLDADGPTIRPVDDGKLERLRILARTPAWGRELDDRVMPAEAGLEERAISFTKGCYPGQEPVARLHYRGHPNRGLRVLALEGDELPDYDAELTLDGKAVGRITSSVADGDSVLALAYVRREVPDDAVLHHGSRRATQLHSPSPRP
jgi:folate-binding protein YgfZ